MKVLISNRDQNIYNRFAEIKIYNCDNFEISQSVIQNEFVVLYNANASFYTLYTNEFKLSIYSTRSTQLVKSGLFLDGLCMMETNEVSGRLAGLSIKG